MTTSHHQQLTTAERTMRSAYAAAFVLAMATPAMAQDTVRIKSTAAPQRGPKVTLTPTFSIGSLDGEPEYSFGSAGAVAVDKSGRFYIYDSQDKILRAYDAAGKFTRNIGRSGKGPGEYEEISKLMIVNDSVLALFDAEVVRVSYFYPNGKLRNSMTNSRLARAEYNTFTIDDDGLAAIILHRAHFENGKRVGGMDQVRYKQMLRFRPDGTLVDSLTLPTQLAQDDSKSFFIASWGGGNNFVAESWNATLRSGGYVAGDGDAMRFLIRPSKGAVRLVERAYKPVPLGTEERANWSEFAASMMSRPVGVGGTGNPRDFKIPAVKPAYKGIFTDDDSRIWIEMYAPAHKIDLPPRTTPSKSPRLFWRQFETYEVFSNTGDYLGRVEFPEQVSLTKAKGNRVWAHASGPDGEDVVRVYTLSGTGSLRK